MTKPVWYMKNNDIILKVMTFYINRSILSSVLCIAFYKKIYISLSMLGYWPLQSITNLFLHGIWETEDTST
jgi:hypothetical protein